MKLYFLLFFFLLIGKGYGQKQLEPGLLDLMPEGIVSVITDIAISPNGKNLCLIGFGGRAYLYDISAKGKIVAGWKNTSISGLKSGGFATYSSNGKYILLRGFKLSTAKIKNVLFSSQPKAWQNSDDVVVLDANTGNVLLEVANAFAISISNDLAFVSNKDGFSWYGLPDGKEIKHLAVEENECASISPSGKYIVESWDADKKSLKDIPSVTKRKSELKNAYKAKKIIIVYEANNLDKAIAYSNDEVDVITNFDFEANEKYVYFQSQLAGEEHTTTPNAFVYQRMNLLTGEIDKSFGMKGNFCKQTISGDKFSSLVNAGTIGLLKQIRIQDPNNASDFALFETRYKLFKNSTLFSPVAMLPNSSIAYVYYEKQLFEWDYAIVKKYFKKAAGASEEEIAEKADSILDKSIENGVLFKAIKKYGITGDFIMDITIVGPKGLVQTVFCESDEKTNIKMQNDLKDIIRKFEFGFDLPKERRIKFRYTFQL